MEFQQRISEVVSRVLLESTGQDLTLTPDQPLIQSGILDSLSMVQLVIALQAEFAVHLDMMDLNEENFADVQSICSLVQSRQ
jgi:acyl carrier protein